jgi:hypothetical protein
MSQKNIKDKVWKEIFEIAEKNLERQGVYRSYSIEEWVKDFEKTYIGRDNRPDVIILALKRNGECYEGVIFK